MKTQYWVILLYEYMLTSAARTRRVSAADVNIYEYNKITQYRV